jgi:DNA-binding response OmpR family regulator
VRLLIVDDEERMATTLAKGLRRRGFAVDVTHRGDAALERVATVDYDVVILDRDLPGVHGDDVCAALVAGRPTARILMLTASSSVDDLVEGLGLGADDYLGKPFEFEELVARVQALLRRPTARVAARVEVGGLVVDPDARQVTRAGRDVALTAREFALLYELARQAGTVLSAEQLLERVWDDHADPFTTSVRVLMSRLRAKLGDPPMIETVIGAGYRLRA